MTSFNLPRKWRLKAHGATNVFVKGSNESAEHVLMKIFIWALYLPEYPDLTVEIKIGDKYKPDVVQMSAPAFDGSRVPVFWGESGQVSVKKIESLTRRFPDTHFALAKWSRSLQPYAEIVREAVADLDRAAPFDLLNIPQDAPERFINQDGVVTITFADVEWIRL